MGMYFVKDWYCQKKGGGADTAIYGAEWTIAASTALTRTDDAVGLSAPDPYYGYKGSSGSSSSPFDEISPWKDMQIVEDSAAGTLVEIPKFYYKWTRTSTTMKLQISMTQHEGFLCSPAHADRGDGVGERDYVYIGRYHCANDFKSKTGVTPKVSMTRADFRTYIHSLGNNIWQNDFAMRWTVNMLYLVEFADWNSQAKIGPGCGDNMGIWPNGYTDNMPYHTGTTQSRRNTYGIGTQYRNIEGWWDNVFDFVDGIYFNTTYQSGLYVYKIYGIKNPANFTDISGGTYIGNRSGANGFIKGWTDPSNISGFEYALYPAVTGNEYSDQSYIGDSCSSSSTGVVLIAGGDWYQYNDSGAFRLGGNVKENGGDTNRGSRLMVLPPSRLTA